MKIFEIIGLIAAMVQICGYYIYYRYVQKGIIKPNTSSWIIWGYGNLIMCINFLFLFTGKITLVAALPIACALANIVIVIAFLRFGKLQKPQPYEFFILFADIGITLFWIFSTETIVTHVLLQIAVLISFIPIWRETREYPNAERSLPWIVWSIAYALFFVAEFGTNGGNLMDLKLLYPVHYLIWHITMAFAAKQLKPSF